MFFIALNHLAELVPDEDLYFLLQNLYEVPDDDIRRYGLMSEEQMLGEGIPVGVPKEKTPRWTVVRHINFEKGIVLAHEKTDCKPPARSLCTMSNAGQKKYAPLFQATVKDSRMGEKGARVGTGWH